MSRRRWEGRPFRAWLVRAFVFLLPIVAAVVIATLVARGIPEPSTLFEHALWWTAVLGSSLAVLTLVDHLARRLLPLAALLQMSLAFPDRAPSRFRIALRTWSTGRLRSEVAAARAQGSDDDPTRAAEFLLTLVAALGSHDRRTRGHAERTRAYADLLAEELKIPAEDRDRLRWAALLHDIGKMGIEADLLNADAPLEEEEWREIRHHPVDGYELSRPLHDFLGPWADTILHHHERWDGTGYPFGLAGEQIAYGARVVAVADAYDAMTAVRTYQDALSSATARRELAAAAGKQFDPTVVRAFLNLSVGSLRRAMGPLTVAAQLPFIGGIKRLGETAGVAMVALVSILGLGAAGMLGGSEVAPSAGAVVAAGAAGGDAAIVIDVDDFLASVDDFALTQRGATPLDRGGVAAATVTVETQPERGTVEVRAGGEELWYLPGPDFAGSDVFTFVACDVAGSCAEIPVLIVDGAAVQPPVVAAGGVASTTTTSTAPTASTTTTAPSTTSTSVAPTSTSVPAPTRTTTTTSTTVPPTTTTTTTTVPPTTTTTTSTTVPPTTTTTVPPTTTTTTTTVPPTTTTTTMPPQPSPPLVVDDDVEVAEDLVAVIPVLANDVDPDGDLDPSSVRVLLGPKAGSTSVDGGVVTFVPDANVNGSDLFVYEVCDLGGRCAQGQVRITVTAVDDPPVAVTDEASSVPGIAIEIDVLANDAEVDGEALSLLPTAGRGDRGGAYECGGTVCRYAPPDPWTGPDGFRYQVTDESGNVVEGSVIVTPTVADIEMFLRAAGPGDRRSTPVLPLSPESGPTNPELPNYDLDRDAAPGLTLVPVSAPSGERTETDPARYQLWLGEPATDPLTVSGEAIFEIWSAMADLSDEDRGAVEVFLLDCPASSIDGTDCLLIGAGAVQQRPWSPGSMTLHSVYLGFVDHVVPAGRSLALRLVVANPQADGPMRFAYDAIGFTSRLVVRVAPPGG